MWNRKKIIPPLVCNMKTALNSSNKIHFRVMKTTMADISHLLSDMVVWKSELHILSKIVYKKHAQRRREKTLQGLKRIESCLDRICAFEGINFLEDISSSLETINLDDESVYLPSKQMLQFVLVKLMGLAALLTQTAGYSVHTFIAAQHDLEIGLFIPQSLFFLSIISRIWVLSKSTCIYIVTWYNSLQKCLDYLEPTQVVWLEDPSMLPVCLKEWLVKFERKTGETERASVVMTDLATPQVDQKLDTEAPLQKVQTHDNIEHEEPARVAILNKDEDVEDDSAEIEEDLGSSISRNDFVSKPKANSIKGKEGVQGGSKCISVDQALERAELAKTLEDLVELVENSECQQCDHLQRNKCVKRLRKLITMSKDRKQKAMTRILRKGQMSVGKFLSLTKGSVTQESNTIKDNVCQKQHQRLSLEELQEKQDVRNMMLNFKRTHLIYLDREGKYLQIDDPDSVKVIQVALRKCCNRLKKNPDSTKQSINKAVKVISSVVDRIQHDNSVISVDEEYGRNFRPSQVPNTTCKVKGKKKIKLLDSSCKQSVTEGVKRKKKALKTNRADMMKIQTDGKEEVVSMEKNLQQKLKKKRKLNISEEMSIGTAPGKKFTRKKQKTIMNDREKLHKIIPKDMDELKSKRSSTGNMGIIPKKKTKK